MRRLGSEAVLVAAGLVMGMGVGVGMSAPNIALAMHSGYYEVRGGLYVEDGKIAPPLRVQNNTRSATVCRNLALNHGKPLTIHPYAFVEVDR